MQIIGLQKLTLLDFPGRLACTVFLGGCNLRCPFCHNASLVLPRGDVSGMTADELLAFLQKRRGRLQGVCVTGGEPTLCPDLPDLLRQIHLLGFEVKLDTNGTNPGMLRALLNEGLVDYVAMDIKNSPARYTETCGGAEVLTQVKESAALLMESGVDYEFRTTLAHPLHTPEDMAAIGQWLQRLDPQHKAGKFFIQPYVDRDSVLTTGLHTPTKEKLLAMREAIAPHTCSAEIRGMD